VLAINTESNGYTIGFAIVMTMIVALVLSGMSTGLKERQQAQVLLDNKFNIVNSVESIDKTVATERYEAAIKEVVIDVNGKEVSGVNALDINLGKELKKDPAEQRFPLYIYTTPENKKQYIIPLFGAGLWDAIGGYIALQDDFTTVAGTVFTHVAETPGLGAEISKPWFQDQFKGEQLMENGTYKGIKVMKSKGNALAKTSEYHVDGISGATITGDGVDVMLDKCLKNYQAYFKQQKGQ